MIREYERKTLSGIPVLVLAVLVAGGVVACFVALASSGGELGWLWLALGLVVSKEAAVQPGAGSPIQEGQALLSACVARHHPALTLRSMDVFEDAVLLRCADCRRHYEVTVTSFETHQR